MQKPGDLHGCAPGDRPGWVLPHPWPWPILQPALASCPTGSTRPRGEGGTMEPPQKPQCLLGAGVVR